MARGRLAARRRSSAAIMRALAAVRVGGRAGCGASTPRGEIDMGFGGGRYTAKNGEKPITLGNLSLNIVLSWRWVGRSLGLLRGFG